MAKLRKKSKRILIKIAAGLTAVLISPLVAEIAGNNTGVIEKLWEGEVAAHAERERAQTGSVTLPMNSSALLLYKPSDTGGEILPKILPPLNINYSGYTASESEDYPFPSELVAQVLSYNITETREEPLKFNVVDGRIVKLNYPANGGPNFLNLDLAGQVRNETALDNDFVINESRKLPEIRLELNGEPEILIMHTHTTEAFQPSEYDFYDASYYGRSHDSDRNIVAVGAEMAKSFAEAGISVIHDGTVHDFPVWNGAYARSAETVRQILQAYPSIKIVLDVHRDAIDNGDGSRVAPVTQVNGRDAAQVMIISAADDGTYDVPYYLYNFRLASLFQQYMEHDSPGITRPVLFQYCQYNQHLTPGSLLVEVGAYGNTLEEAMYAGRLIGRSMAEALLSLAD